MANTYVEKVNRALREICGRGGELFSTLRTSLNAGAAATTATAATAATTAATGATTTTPSTFTPECPTCCEFGQARCPAHAADSGLGVRVSQQCSPQLLASAAVPARVSVPVGSRGFVGGRGRVGDHSGQAGTIFELRTHDQKAPSPHMLPDATATQTRSLTTRRHRREKKENGTTKEKEQGVRKTETAGGADKMCWSYSRTLLFALDATTGSVFRAFALPSPPRPGANQAIQLTKHQVREQNRRLRLDRALAGATGEQQQRAREFCSAKALSQLRDLARHVGSAIGGDKYRLALGLVLAMDADIVSGR